MYSQDYFNFVPSAWMSRDWIDENYSQDYSQIVFGKSQECIQQDHD